MLLLLLLCYRGPVSAEVCDRRQPLSEHPVNHNRQLRPLSPVTCHISPVSSIDSHYIFNVTVKLRLHWIFSYQFLLIVVSDHYCSYWSERSCGVCFGAFVLLHLRPNVLGQYCRPKYNDDAKLITVPWTLPWLRVLSVMRHKETRSRSHRVRNFRFFHRSTMLKLCYLLIASLGICLFHTLWYCEVLLCVEMCSSLLICFERVLYAMKYCIKAILCNLCMRRESCYLMRFNIDS